MDLHNGELSVRELPHSVEAEQTVLGGMLVDPDVIPTVIECVRPEYFFQDNHRLLFGIIIRLFSVGRDIDFVVLINEAVAAGIFQTEQMAKVYLRGIMDSIPSVSNIKSYCEIVENMYHRRTLISAANDILAMASDGQTETSLLLDSAEQKIYDIRRGKLSDGMSRVDDIIVPTLEHLSKLSGPDKDQYLGTKTGFGKLDEAMTGLHNTDLIIVAARPGMGKSAFVLNMATNICKSGSQKSVCIFSLEMGKEQLVSRMLSSESLVNSHDLRSGQISLEQWKSLAHGADELARMPIYLDETSGITVPQMKAKLRRIPNCGLAIIDYLQLMSSPNRYNNRVLEISEITRQLKLMAKELEIPVILCSQLNRSVESRTDKHPQLADLRESGSIEQDADIILFLYREGYYNKEQSDQTTSEVIIAKNRHGETGKIKLAWVGDYTLFRNIDYRSDEETAP